MEAQKIKTLNKESSTYDIIKFQKKKRIDAKQPPPEGAPVGPEPNSFRGLSSCVS